MSINQPETSANVSPSKHRTSLLDLPYELQIQIFSLILPSKTIIYRRSQEEAQLVENIKSRLRCPGTVDEHLNFFRQQERSVPPSLMADLASGYPTALLRTCRRTYLDVRDLLYSNEVFFSVEIPSIDEMTIPGWLLSQQALSRIKRACIVIDCATYRVKDKDWARMDYTPFADFESLEVLYLAVVQDDDRPLTEGLCYGMIQSILSRLPKSVKTMTDVGNGQRLTLTLRVFNTLRLQHNTMYPERYSLMRVSELTALVQKVQMELAGGDAVILPNEDGSASSRTLQLLPFYDSALHEHAAYPELDSHRRRYRDWVFVD